MVDVVDNDRYTNNAGPQGSDGSRQSTSNSERRFWDCIYSRKSAEKSQKSPKRPTRFEGARNWEADNAAVTGGRPKKSDQEVRERQPTSREQSVSRKPEQFLGLSGRRKTGSQPESEAISSRRDEIAPGEFSRQQENRAFRGQGRRARFNALNLFRGLGPQDRVEKLANQGQDAATRTSPEADSRQKLRSPDADISGQPLEKTQTDTLRTGASPSQVLPPHLQNLPDQPIPRLADPAYGDGVNSLGGRDRPNPRAISNTVSEQGGEVSEAQNGASSLLWNWGQFIDHDIVATVEGEEPADIDVPAGDPWFDAAGTGAAKIAFNRSEGAPDENGVRQQTNIQTPFIDGSMVYGADEESAQRLRSDVGGKMRVSEDNFLPVDEEGNTLAGDGRAGEQPGLKSLHTLFIREHNRLADEIAAENNCLSDDEIYEEARRRNTQQIQAITYNEFLPVLLGGNAPEASTYRDGVDGRISSEFSTAAYRVGHTMVNDTLTVQNADGTTQSVPLRDVFFNPDFTEQNGIGNILGGLGSQNAEAVDPQIVGSLRNALFGPPGSGGLDLASLNIQRGRDHGIPSYNDMRESLGLRRVESFDDSIFQGDFGSKLGSVYNDPDEVDLWIGGLAEKSDNDSMLGETFTKIVADQFFRTAAADPNFYTNTASKEELAYLESRTLSDIIRDNSNSGDFDDTAFIVENTPGYA